MARELQLARRRLPDESLQVEADGAPGSSTGGHPQSLSLCENRTVSKDGRIICSKIIEGDNEVSPNTCRDCPFRAVDCSHLRFSLRMEAASPLVVRYNGRTEVWDDGPAELSFERAACSAKVMPVYGPRSCTGCVLRQPMGLKTEQPRQVPRVVGNGKVVSFPSREALAAAG
jgi:hypothetical protein